MIKALGYKARKPVDIALTAHLQNDYVIISIRVTGEMLLICDRCGEETPYVLDLTEKKTINVLDFGEKYDVTKHVKEIISLSLPARILCRDSCKGLCQGCGKNLNFGNCECKNVRVDFRFEKLKEIKFPSNKKNKQ